MEDSTTPATGGCMCGAVRYAASGEPLWVGHCHCESCRSHTGAPLVTFVAFKKHEVEFTGTRRQIYESSAGIGRAFCGNCGTPLTWEAKSSLPERGEIVEFHISTLDDPNAFTPTDHVFYGEKISWFDVADNLPRYIGFDFDGELCQHGPTKNNLPG